MANLRTALYDAHVAQHARMVPFAGWDMPVQYASIIEEHKAVRSAVGMFDVSHMARFSFGGTDAAALLEKVFTNSVATMKEMQVRYGLVCNADGGTLDDVIVYRWPYGYAMVANGSNHDKILAWLKQHATGDVQITDETPSTVMLAVQGPKAIDAVAGLFPDDVSKLKYFFALPTRYHDRGCVVSRTGYTGEDGFEITVPNELGVALWDAMLARGVKPCGLGSRDTLRLEAAMPLYGHELTEKIDPLQAGLDWAVKLNKDFIGRDALKSASEAAGHRPKRVGLLLEGKRAARQECVLLADESTPVGVVTSGSFVPWLDQSIAMGYVAPRHAAPGTPLLVDIRGTHVPAAVVPLPFYSRKK
ncbi:glycine cleavage system aminomethyltransferase GcvT [Limnoglobus roseus]|uniref:Aminomethyltransferase n=1 Tax=Limnoglobus roseus TaxID=2598579 RepID=A0A5C1A5V5_9BACT|nr:glycine cleavage system aminomethyltransferase GcvT [Limnoglobus roseus]QEL13212.1 glycine cleavage system aminomethyltransferase GcvT [Limnoglobus roseus]